MVGRGADGLPEGWLFAGNLDDILGPLFFFSLGKGNVVNVSEGYELCSLLFMIAGG